MRLLHYSEHPLTEPLEDCLLYRYDKPRSFWVSVEGPDDWKSWCEAQDFRLGRLAHVHEVTLTDRANVLILDTTDAVTDFGKEFGSPRYCRGHFDEIDWPTVMENWDGIIIAPYQWDIRRSNHGWYYNWDCASGSIWRPSRAVASVRLVERVMA